MKLIVGSLAWIGCWICSTASGAVVLPIEVMGRPPHTETNTLEIAAGRNLVGAKLVVRAHNVSYEDKGRIAVNGGSVYKIWNDTDEIHVAEPDRSYGGFGGGFGTVTFRMDASDINLTVGENTIEFTYQWRHPDHGTAGYRIVSLDIVDAAGQSVLAENQISFDNPSLWEPPLTDPDQILAGKDFFENANIGGIGLSCNNCHTHDGRDFKYFNISNKVIIEQCKKSGFTKLQGEQLASYIRTLPFDAPALARPWNPPYQPGPGTDSRPVFEWAAGAGLDAVLKTDAEMLPHMFGSGTQAEIDAVTDIRTNMNLREIPISLQFPDWIHWIPRVHPMQIWGTSAIIGSNGWETVKSEKFPDWNNPYEAYLDLKEQFENGLATKSDLVDAVRNDFQKQVRWWVDPGDQFHPWCEQEGKILDLAKANGFTAEKAKLELSRWRAVKLWGLFNAYDAEDKADDFIPTAEKYQWPAKMFSVFQIAAHFIGDDRGTSCFAWEMDRPEVGIYFSSIWYQLQMILNPGMREGQPVSPVDWSYNYAHVNLLGEQTGIHEPLRLVQNLIKGYQQRDVPGSTEVEDTNWTMREVSPWRHYSNYDGDQTSYQQLDSYDEGLRLRILRSMLGQFVRRVNEYGTNAWTRIPEDEERNDGYWWQMEPVNYIPVLEPDDPTNFKLFAQSDIGDAIEPDAMYRLIPLLYAAGLEPASVQPLVDWCADMWPLGDWQARATDSDGDSLHDYWEGLHYGTLDWGPDDDPNGLGMINRDAYIYGASSNYMELSPRMTVSPQGDEMAFVYERPTFMSGSQFVIDYSTNLVTWQSEKVHTARTNEIDELYESVTELHALSSDDAMFFRLRRLDDAQLVSVQFNSLSDGDIVVLGDNLTITANVAGLSPANIQFVYLNLDDTPHSTDRDAPYTFNVTDLTEGAHSLTLWLKDSSDNWIGSGKINITVEPREVDFATLSDGDILTLGEDLEVTARVSGINPADIASIKLNLDGDLHSRDDEAPYTFHITDLSAGSHDLKLWLKYTDGLWLGSDTISITVAP